MAKRTKISPSDLTFTLSNCPRCLWLKYTENLTAPMTMPLVGDLADLQEKYYVGKPASVISPDLPEGTIARHGGWVSSKKLMHEGEETEYIISGKYDLVIEFTDGTIGIIDCKFSAKDSNKSEFYRPQLEAYAHAMENPAEGDGEKVSMLGLMVWSLPTSLTGSEPGVNVNTSWQPVDRDPAKFETTLKKLFGVINGARPATVDNCNNCTYVKRRHQLLL